MLAGHTLWQITGAQTWYVLFETGAAATGLAVFLFAVNMVGVLGPAEHAASCGMQAQSGSSASPPISKPAQEQASRSPKHLDEHITLGAMVTEWPRTLEVLERYFGKDCFSCPGLSSETPAESARLHNRSEERRVGKECRSRGSP